MKAAAASGIIALIIVVSFISASGQATKMSRDEIDVRLAVGTWANAVKSRDPRVLDTLFADDLFITDYTGGTRGKKEELEVLKPSDTVKTVSVTNENIVVRIYDKSKTAVVTAVVKMAFDIAGKPSSITMRYTSVWEKRKGIWQLVVLQTVRVTPPKT